MAGRKTENIPDEFDLVETSMSKEAVVMLSRAPSSGKYYRLVKMFDGWIEAGGDDIMEIAQAHDMSPEQRKYCAKEINKVATGLGRKDIVSYTAADRLFIIKQEVEHSCDS